MRRSIVAFTKHLHPHPQSRAVPVGIEFPTDYAKSSALSDIDPFLASFDWLPTIKVNNGFFPTFTFPVDLRDTKEGVEIDLDIPGVHKKDISIVVNHRNELVVSAHKDVSKKSMKHQERFIGHVSRTIPLPDHIMPDIAVAEYHQGVLHIWIPKSDHDIQDTHKTISIK
jgi:HSP20 family protein